MMKKEKTQEWISEYLKQHGKSIHFPYKWFNYDNEFPEHPLIALRKVKGKEKSCGTGALFLYLFLWSRKLISIKTGGFTTKDGDYYVVCEGKKAAEALLTTETTIIKWFDWLEKAGLIRRIGTKSANKIIVYDPWLDTFDLVKKNGEICGYNDMKKKYVELPEESKKIESKVKPPKTVTGGTNGRFLESIESFKK
jgi:hypothetical protein